MKIRLREPAMAVLFLIPAFIGLAIFYYYPIAQTIIYSLYRLGHTTDWLNAPFGGLHNYIKVLGDDRFWLSLRYTLYFTVLSLSLQFLIGLGMALATFWVHPRLRGILRAVILIPWAIPSIINASMWRWLFHTDVGLIGDIMVKLGLVSKPPLFLVDLIWARHSVILAYVWKAASSAAIFFMGGLAMIPQDIYDAAKVDGARAWLRFRRITLPLLLPTIIVVLLFSSMSALKVFDIVYGLTGGGPGIMTEVLSSFSYKFYFTYGEFGMGSAYAIITFLLVMGLSFLYIRRLQPHLRLGR